MEASRQSSTKDEWNRIGFHRALGGFWYNYILVLASAVFAVLFMFYILPNFVLPFPEAIGFQNLITNLFAVYFMLADVGVGRAIQRYVAEENIKNPLKAIAYLQFFVWFQMFTGLAQVTIISVWALYMVPATNLAYAAWFITIYSTIQYPGMLGVFHGALSGFQRFDKANLISFAQAVLLENSTRVACILLGRWVGANDPAIGELMGATIGSIIGSYIDDFLAAAIAAVWTRPLLKDINPDWGIKKVFGVDFDRALAKECMWYGIKSILPSTFHQANQFLQMILLITFVPNYATILGLFSLAEMVSGMVGMFKFNMASTVSEAYNNGKVELCASYQARSYCWIGLSSGFLVVIIFLAAPLLGKIAGPDFVLAAPMIQVLAVGRIGETFGSVNADVFMGCDKPEYYLYTNALEAISRATFLWLGLAYWRLGWLALAMGRIAGWWFRFLSGVVLMRKKLFKPVINAWQMIVAPAIAAGAELAVLWSFIELAYPVLEASIGLVAAAAITVLLAIFFLPFFLFFPVYALVGGWDEGGLRIFERAATISGPSRWLIAFICRISRQISEKSPLFNKFPIDETVADRQIAELMAIRDATRERMDGGAGAPVA